MTINLWIKYWNPKQKTEAAILATVNAELQRTGTTASATSVAFRVDFDPDGQHKHTRLADEPCCAQVTVNTPSKDISDWDHARIAALAGETP